MNKQEHQFLLTLLCVLAVVQGFVVVRQHQPASPTTKTTTTTLFGRKRGGLSSIASEGGPTTTKKTTLKQRSKRVKNKGKSSNSKKGSQDATTGSGSAISPDLANFFASQESDEEVEVDDVSGTDATDEEEDDTVSFQSFEEETKSNDNNSIKKGNSRRIKQSERKEMETQRAGHIKEGVDALKSALEESGNLDGILSAVQDLMALPSESLRLLIAGKRRHNYRLAWVGGDDAISHIGTGLHKVPLARLQEVFMSYLGRNRMEVLEVIRILGPFPNVKNILQGTTQITSKGGDDVTTLNIVVDSMVDGTGKEILAGTEDNIRRVDLQVYFADERAIVAVVPPDGDGYRSNPLEDNGANVLVFIKEEELEEKLDALRVL